MDEGLVNMAKKKRRYSRNKKISLGGLIAIGGPAAIALERWKSRGWEFALLSLSGIRVGRAAEGTDKVFDYEQAIPAWSAMAVGVGMKMVGSKFVNKHLRDIPFIKL